MKDKNIIRRIVSAPPSPPPSSTPNDMSSYQAHPNSPTHSLVTSPPDPSHPSRQSPSHQSPTHPISPPVSPPIALSPPCIDDSEKIPPSTHRSKAMASPP